eukprot:CAMPEP_0179072910 /NCGR_PEP_ID=MMETSP0796-20121207/32299_1 /TAXON_ID=73915 /ORGANISM="Pyrodinium bahamense, Strain pbaha01" /LENGTH=60 /DNA_ID=CAMNT_0020770087 /DNA_START=1 /DNA_END=180 /DNA_ORIENTATION=+
MPERKLPSIAGEATQETEVQGPRSKEGGGVSNVRTQARASQLYIAQASDGGLLVQSLPIW